VRVEDLRDEDGRQVVDLGGGKDGLLAGLQQVAAGKDAGGVDDVVDPPRLFHHLAGRCGDILAALDMGVGAGPAEGEDVRLQAAGEVGDVGADPVAAAEDHHRLPGQR